MLKAYEKRTGERGNNRVVFYEIFPATAFCNVNRWETKARFLASFKPETQK